MSAGARPGDSRDLADLHPRVRALAEALLARAAAAGIVLRVTFTYRSLATQAALYARGRTAPGAIVTHARAGDSLHNYGLAFDVVPIALLSQVDWGDTPARHAATDALWARVGAIGEALGLRWGGAFHSISDRPHFEWSGGLTLAELKRGRRPAGPA